MQRPCISRDKKFGMPQQSNELPQIKHLDNRLRRSSVRANSLRQMWFTRPKTDDASPSVFPCQRAMQLAVSLRWPALRTPTASWRKHKVVGNSLRRQNAFDLFRGIRYGGERKANFVRSRARCFHQFQIVFHFMQPSRADDIGVEKHCAAFP